MVSALNKNKLKIEAKKIGLLSVGDFLIGRKNSDIISGFAIDSAPSRTYIWEFVLPFYDKLPFMHMSLGQRISKADLSYTNFPDLLKIHWPSLSPVANASDLISFMDMRGIGGEYPDWVRLISYVRAGQFDQAGQVMVSIDAATCSASVAKNLLELREAIDNDGWSGASLLLEKWASRTDNLLPKVPHEFFWKP